MKASGRQLAPASREGAKGRQWVLWGVRGELQLMMEFGEGSAGVLVSVV